MNEIINITEPQISIKTCYDPSLTPSFEKDTKPNPKAIESAKEELTPLAFRLYEILCSLPNRAFVVRPIEVLAEKMNVPHFACEVAIEELKSHRYLNYTQVRYNDDTYIGETFMFIPDNSIVAVVPEGYVATTSEEYAQLLAAWKKPFCFTGKITTVKETF